ncbi:MAG: serine protease [Clostridia bacterium]|nr:serine protease [Clostridia bacterium]
MNENNNYPENGSTENNNQDIPWYQQASNSQPQNSAPESEPENVYTNETEFTPVTDDAEPVQQAEQPFEEQPAAEPEIKKEPAYSPYSSEYHYNYNYQNNAQGGSTENKTGKKGSSKRILAIILAVVVVFCGVFGTYLVKNRNKNSSSGNNSASVSDSPTLQINDKKSVADVDESDGLSSEEIYAKNQKSNVGIILYASSQGLFSQNGSTSQKSNVAGEGSGIVMGTSKDKSTTYIITCAHVISNANSKNYKIVVQDYEGNQYDAEYVGADSKTDIGVVSVKTDKLTAAEFGDSSKLVIGETVYAIGNPGGTEFFGSFTKGMISSIDRPVSNEIGYEMKSIQHDAAINPGNSGGMLLNSSGQVIGINSSKIASTEYEGMGFSIPITSAKPIIDDLIAHGYVTNRPKLGITYSPVSAYPMYAMIAHYNNLPAGSLIIREISQKSAFNGTEVKAGDLITAVNGEKMETADVLLDKIENGKVGDQLKLTICRINENNYEISSTFDVTVTLVEDNGQVETTTQATQSIEDFFSPFFGN